MNNRKTRSNKYISKKTMSSGIIDKNNTYLNRRSIRLEGFDYTKQGAYFITICTNNRDYLFGEIVNDKMILNEYGEIANTIWRKIPNHFPNVELYEYIIMPNHVHGIIVIDDRRGTACRAPTITNRTPIINYPNEITNRADTINNYNAERIEQFGKPISGSIPTIVRSYKSAVTKYINELKDIKRKSLWQRNYYDRILRDDIELNIKRKYIINNPARWNEDENNPAVYKNTVKNISRD